MEYTITHNQNACRFETTVEGNVAYVQYIPFIGGLDFTHTWVPKKLEGKGIASALVKYGMDYARDNNLKVIPTCSYVKAFLLRHTEYK